LSVLDWVTTTLKLVGITCGVLTGLGDFTTKPTGDPLTDDFDIDASKVKHIYCKIKW